MKVTKAIWDTLPAGPVKDAFKPNPANADEYDNGEEEAGGLKTALQKEKEAAAGLKTKLDGFEAAKAKEIEDARKAAVAEARTKGDFKTVEEDYQRQIKELKDAQTKAAKDAEKRTKQDALDKAADEVASMFTVPKAMKSFVRERLSVDLVDGEAIVRVLKDGKASGMSLADLKNEYLTDKDLKGSIAASKASGGGSGGAPPRGGSGDGKTDTDKPFDAATADPKAMIAHLEAKGAVGGDEGDDD